MIKYFLKCVCFFVLPVCMCGCDELSIEMESKMQTAVEERKQTETELISNSVSEHIYFWTDPETGVQYVVYREKVAYAGLAGITPRLNADGSLMIDTDNRGENNVD